MGPADAVATDASPTATTSSAVRARSTGMPSPRAVSSPYWSPPRTCASSSAAGTSTARAIPTGTACSQPRALRLPLSQTYARAASNTSATTSSQCTIASSIACRPMPTSTSRKPCTPLRQASP